MREIKFRIWNKYHKKMYNAYELNFDCSIAKCREIKFGTTHTFGFIDLEIMQYTGLKDRNGVEIYEGDKLSLFSGVTVLFYNGCFGYGVRTPHINFDFISFHQNVSINIKDNIILDCEIIGNIYQNPELLKK